MLAGGYVQVRHPVTKKLLFRYDPARQLIEIQARGERTIIDLTQYSEADCPEPAGDGGTTQGLPAKAPAALRPASK